MASPVRIEHLGQDRQTNAVKAPGMIDFLCRQVSVARPWWRCPALLWHTVVSPSCPVDRTIAWNVKGLLFFKVLKCFLPSAKPFQFIYFNFHKLPATFPFFKFSKFFVHHFQHSTPSCGQNRSMNKATWNLKKQRHKVSLCTVSVTLEYSEKCSHIELQGNAAYLTSVCTSNTSSNALKQPIPLIPHCKMFI